MSEVIDSTAVEEPGTDLAPIVAPPPASLFRTDDPVEVLAEAKRIADALAPVIRGANLVSNINGKDYLNVEAWQTLGQQLGVTGVIVATTKIDKGWEATCEARTLDGRTIGSADSMCTRDEVVKGTKRWEGANEFEVRSMAQTRAMSRALASVLRFIPTLAGMGGTPAEEMDRARESGGNGGGKGFASDKQRFKFDKTLQEAGFSAQEVGDIGSWAATTQHGGRGGGISRTIDALLDDSKRDEAVAWLRERVGNWMSDGAPAEENVPVETVEGDEDIPF